MNAPEYNIQSIAKVMNGEVIRLFQNNRITRLSIDSRKLTDPESVLFFALKGPQHDGHQFIRELYNRGVRNFVVSETTENVDLLYEANLIRVKSSRKALQDLAAYHRAQFDLTTIGITGSNGKTVVKEWLYQLLQEQHHIIRSPRSYNSQVGVPLSVWNIEQSHTLGIFEAGISKPGEMEFLQPIINPEMGVFINLREAHDSNFSNREEKALEKLKLFRNCRTLIYNCDYPEIKNAIEHIGGLPNTRLIRCSRTNPEAEYFLESIEKQEDNAKLTIKRKNDIQKVLIPFNDNGSIENALLCYAAALEIESPVGKLVSGLESLQPVAMRLQMIEGINGCGVINDAYNSDMASLEIALDFANQQRFLEKKTLILSDILQSGLPSKELYARVASMCKQKKIGRLIGIGPKITDHAELFNLPADFYPDTDRFIESIRTDQFSNELILIKGARPFKFERISMLLEKQLHETVFEINLDALEHNLNYFRSRLSPQTGIMAMVKAFSYGMGSYELAHLLEFNKVAYLGVAYTDEGISLRKAGVQLPIMVMNPEASGYDAMIRYELEPEIYSFRTLRTFMDACEKRMIQESYPIHIKVDTGMSRLGFEECDTKKLIKMLNDSHFVRVTSAFSHLAGADNPDHDDFTRSQIALFSKITQEIQRGLKYNFRRHILNSAGILRFPEHQFEMVRLGIGLYGYLDGPEAMKNLMPSSRLRTTISQIKHLKSGATVGYQRAGKISEASRIATLPIGYADGFPRMLGNGAGEVSINGYRAKTIGNICMDMCMVDVSQTPCKEGDEVEVIGEEISLHEMARRMKTIPYEVITGISRRVKRIYYRK